MSIKNRVDATSLPKIQLPWLQSKVVDIDQTTAQQTMTNAAQFVDRVEQFLQDTNVL